MFTAFVKPTCIDRGLISAYLWNIKYTRRRTYYTIQAYKKLRCYIFFSNSLLLSLFLGIDFIIVKREIHENGHFFYLLRF